MTSLSFSPRLRVLTVVGAVLALPIYPAKAENQIVERPLAPRSGPRGATLFQNMGPEQTGIVTSNPYDDPRMWGDLYQEFVYGSIGTGVAIGDYDNDGRPDLFVVNKTGQGRLFRNLGNWHFEDVTEKAGLLAGPQGAWTNKAKQWFGVGAASDASAIPWTQGVTFADVNNDGLLDIYICRFNAPNLLYINQGDGTFKEEAGPRGVAVVDSSVMAAFCDYDRDGKLDLYLQTNLLDAKAHPSGQRDYLFHNNGDGTFTDVTAKAGMSGESQGHSAIWWDFDQDGWPDLYVANDFVAPDRLFHNNHDGTFTDVINGVVPHMPHSSMGADLGDVNNDGLIDFLVADMAATTHEKDQRGLAEIRVKSNTAASEVGLSPQYMRNALYINTGTGRMLEAAFLASLAKTNWTWSVLLADLDNDGRLDAFFTNGTVREFHNIDVEQRMSASESFAERVRAIKDSPPLDEPNLAFRNLGDLNFEEVGHLWGLDRMGVSFGAALGDLDGDGDLDLVFSNFQSGVTVLRNDSEQGHRVTVALRGTKSNRFGIGATVEIETVSGKQIRPLILARGYLSSSEPIVHFGLGDDTLIKHLIVRWPSGAEQTFQNLAVDRSYVITENGDASREASNTARVNPIFVEAGQRLGLASVSAEKSDPGPRRAELRWFGGDHAGPSLAVGHLSSAEAEDVVIGGTTQAPRRWYQLSGDKPARQLAAPWSAEALTIDDGAMLIFDLNGDGANDLMVLKSGTTAADPVAYRAELWLNDGQGHLSPAPDGTLPAIQTSIGAAAAADFERTGKVGVFLGGRGWPAKYPLAPRSFLLANREGKLVDVTDSAAPALKEIGLVNSAVWSDVDGDGAPDLLLAILWGGVRYFHNDGRGHLEDWTERAGFSAAGNGWWTSLASADFNQDGRPDFVAGNVGLNTPFRASIAEPAFLYYGSLAPGTGPIALETETEGGRVYPRLTRGELAEKIPSIMRKFPRNDDYARASVEEIFGSDRLTRARKYTATEFRSGVFLSQPDGTYRFAALPRIAQIAPFQSIVAGDFDGDGLADIYALQNSFAPLPSVGHFDGGLSQLLKGDGRGGFVAVSPKESGLLVPDDARGLAVLGLGAGSQLGFIATRNNASTLAFELARPVESFLRVVLKGSAANRDAIGAKLTLELTNHTSQTAEIRAGQGVVSQSAASCFFGYTAEARPVRLTVRWPDGKKSERDFVKNPLPLANDRSATLVKFDETNGTP